MPLSPRTRRVRVSALASAIAVTAVVLTPQHAFAGELAVAEGPIAIQPAAAGQRSVACGELFVEARDALDNHLIARTRPEFAADGSCRYAISVPAQSAVWLRLRPALVAAARATAPDGTAMPGGNAPVVAAPAPAAPFVPSSTSGHRISSRGVQIRFTVIAPTTNFFAPGERKTVPLTY
jgi:hypothetical protein